MPYKYSYQNQVGNFLEILTKPGFNFVIFLQYSCSPPPLFMLGVSLLQAAIFAYNSAVMYAEIRYIGLNGPVPYCSRLIYDPDKREQVWRYLTYMFIHSGLFHATFNILIQLVLGIPLEMVHGEGNKVFVVKIYPIFISLPTICVGWWRVMLVYLSGVLAGSLWTSVLRPNVFLSGASGGVYALITAHLGTVIMNFRSVVHFQLFEIKYNIHTKDVQRVISQQFE